MPAPAVDTPALPAAEVRAVPGRGEIFLRRAEGPAHATPVLLVHGWQATADLNFLPLYGPLSERHQVVAPDLRGHGRSLYPEEPFTIESAADDCAALLRDLRIDRAIVVGYSLGTAVAQTMVERHRDLVAGIVLAGGELAPAARPHEKFYVRVGGWLATSQRLSSGRRGAHAVVSKAARETAGAEAYRTWLVREMERGHSASLREAGRALGRFDGRPMAARHREMPSAIVLTTRDRLVRPARQRALAQAWDAPVVDLDADHDAPIAQPQRFVGALLDAIGQVEKMIPAGAMQGESVA